MGARLPVPWQGIGWTRCFLADMQEAVCCGIPGSEIRKTYKKTKKRQKSKTGALKCNSISESNLLFLSWSNLMCLSNKVALIVTGFAKSVKASQTANRSVMGTLGFSPKLLWLVGFHVSGAETWIPHWRNPHSLGALPGFRRKTHTQWKLYNNIICMWNTVDDQKAPHTFKE